MWRKDLVNRTEEELFEDYLYRQSIYEEQHVFMTCGDAIDNISEQIQNEYQTETGRVKTEWYFIPDEKECTQDSSVPNTLEIIKEYVNIPDDNMRMCVMDDDDNPNIILLFVNSYAIESMRNGLIEPDNKEMVLRHIKPWVKHEFGHILQNFGTNKKGVKLVNNKKFTSNNIDTTLLNINPAKFRTVQNMMYLFSPAEIDQRCAELYQYVNEIPEEEIFDKSDKRGYTTIHNIISHIIHNTQLTHLKEDIDYEIQKLNAMYDTRHYSLAILIAFYFKKYNLYKTSDTLSASYVEEVVNNENYGEEYVRRLYAKHFIDWIDKQSLNYTKKIYHVVYYSLYKRFWEQKDIERYGVTMSSRISNGVIEYLNKKFGDDVIPLFE